MGLSAIQLIILDVDGVLTDGVLIQICGGKCVNSTGDVYISGAGRGLKLHDGARFCTTGDLEFKSSQVGVGSTTTSIFVAEDNAVAIFSVDVCSGR